MMRQLGAGKGRDRLGSTVVRGGWIQQLVIGWACVGMVSAVPAVAGAATVALGEASVVAGQGQAGIPLLLTLAAGEQVSAFEVNIYFDPSVAQWGAIALEPTLTALGKQVEAQLLAPGHVRMLLYGLDRQTLSSGTVGQCLMQASATAPAGTTLVDLQNGTGSTPDGSDLSLVVYGGRLWIEAPLAPLQMDTTPPSLTVTSPAAGAVFVDGQSVTVSGVASDDQPGVSVSINGQQVTLESTGSFSHAISGLTVGTHTIVILALDAAGNRTEVQRSVTIKAKDAEPSLSIVSPLDGSTVTGPTVYLQVQVIGVTLSRYTASLRIQVDGGSAKYVYTTKPFAMKQLKPGPHTVSVQLVDRNRSPLAGTNTSATARFTVK